MGVSDVTLRKVHAMTGVFPLGIVVVEHVWVQARVLGGPDPYVRTMGASVHAAWWTALDLVFVLLPLAFHATYGVMLTVRGADDGLARGDARRGHKLLEGAAGIVALAFVLAHVWAFRVHAWLFGLGHDAQATRLIEHLSWTWGGLPLVALGYLIGLAATLFYMFNGLVALIARGPFRSNGVRQRAGVMATILGAALFLVSTNAVVALATGKALFPRPAGTKSARCETLDEAR